MTAFSKALVWMSMARVASFCLSVLCRARREMFLRASSSLPLRTYWRSRCQQLRDAGGLWTHQPPWRLGSEEAANQDGDGPAVPRFCVSARLCE